MEAVFTPDAVNTVSKEGVAISDTKIHRMSIFL